MILVRFKAEHITAASVSPSRSDQTMGQPDQTNLSISFVKMIMGCVDRPISIKII
jgi:hypothetical protein